MNGLVIFFLQNFLQNISGLFFLIYHCFHLYSIYVNIRNNILTNLRFTRTYNIYNIKLDLRSAFLMQLL